MTELYKISTFQKAAALDGIGCWRGMATMKMMDFPSSVFQIHFNLTLFCKRVTLSGVPLKVGAKHLTTEGLIK